MRLSEPTRALIGSSLPDGVSVHALGERRLKDIDEPERIYELEIEGVEQAEGTPPATGVEEAEDDWDRRSAELGARLSKKINEDVYNALERSFGLDKRD